MNLFLSRAINMITSNIKGVKAILLSGSQQTESIIDIWSDTDVLVILDSGINLEERHFLQVINEIGFVVGSELYKRSEQSLACRTAIKFDGSVQLLDIQISSYNDWITVESVKNQSYSIVYGDIEIKANIDENLMNFSFDSYESSNTWFKYFITIKKIARNDNLIGLHLLLDLIREYLVVEMIERDIKYGTNVHRFGYDEQLPTTVNMSRINLSDKVKIFDFIKDLAFEYDNKLVRRISGYQSRYELVANYIEKSKNCITTQ